MPTPEVLAWIRGRWIPALRSGEYGQTKGVLRRSISHTEQRYCCLGVACDLAIKDGMLPGWTNDNEIPEPSQSSPISYTLLPDSLAEFLGMDHHGQVRVRHGVFTDHSLAGANDQDATFGEIADALESWCDEQEALQSS